MFRDLNCAYTNEQLHCKIGANFASMDNSRVARPDRFVDASNVLKIKPDRVQFHMGCFPIHRINTARTTEPTTRLIHGEIPNATGSVPSNTQTIATTNA